MHIITRKRLLEAAKKHPNAKGKIAFWFTVTKKAVWTNLAETKKSFGHADQVTVESGRTVTIFNISNDYRLITAIHYNRKKVFILRFLTHAEYDRDKWKETL
jgi:mRNA interferase HigB